MMCCGPGGLELLLLMIPFLILPALGILLPFVGFFLPPPKRRPDGVLYWISLSLLSIGLAILGRWLGWNILLYLPAVILALLANTFWARGAARSLREDLEDGERREALRRLSRRLWFPLQCLSFLVFLGMWLP